MKALIMAGGVGTRLRPLTCNVPKPMVVVANRPILEHTVGLLRKHKFTEIVFLLHYLPEQITNHFGDGSKFGVATTYVTAYHDYGTAGAVKQAAHLIDDTCLIISGDAITDLDLTGFTEFHLKNKSLLTLALAQVPDPSPFGIAITDKSQRITRFLEKPSLGEIFSDTVNMGIYIVEPEALDFIPDEKEFFFARDLFPKLLAQGQPMFGFLDECYWRDIGNLKAYHDVHQDIQVGKIELASATFNEDTVAGEGCQLGKNVTLDGKVVLGDHLTIGDNVSIENSFLGSDSYIGKGTTVKNCILWDGVEIGAHCELVRDVIGSKSTVGDNCSLDEDVLVSDQCKIGRNSRISANVKIWPGKDVDPGSEVVSSLVWGEKWQRELISEARVTGLANFEVSPEFGARLGAAIGAWIGKGKDVLVSRDATPAARMIYRSAMCGLMSAGAQVQDLQVAPIPIVRYTLNATKNFGGIHVRRSPIERKLLDILIFDGNGRDITPGTARIIERIFYREDFPRVAFDEVGDIDYPVRMSNAYIQDFLSHVNVDAIGASKFKIVIDYSHGSAVKTFSSIMGSLDCELIALNASQDSKKLTHTAVSFEKALHQLATIVKSTNSQMGFLLDAGAERVFCVDESGTLLSGGRLVVLITKLLLETTLPEKIAVKVSVPSQVETLARERNIELVYTPEGTGALIKATEDSAVDYAVDSDGGFIFPPFNFAFDGMYSIVKILELLAITGSSLRSLHEEMDERPLAEGRVPCPWEAKGKVMRHLDEYSTDRRRLAIDGVKIYVNDSWVLVTPHKEKAFYKVIAEANSPHKAKSLVEEFKQRVQDWRDA